MAPTESRADDLVPRDARAGDVMPSAPQSMRSSIVRGAAWKFVSQLTLQASRLVVAIILARLLEPDDFGMAGMVLVFSGLGLILTDVSFGAALVRRPVVRQVDSSTVFWTSAAGGILLSAIGIAASGPVARFYGQPQVQGLFAAVSVTFAFAALGTTQRALLTRSMDFRRLELRNMGSTFAAAIVGIAVAIGGGGAWAIIAQQVTNTAVSTVLLSLVVRWRPSFAFSVQSFRELGRFGANVFGTHILWYANSHVDNLLIGKFIGPAALGIYVLAYNIILFPMSRIARPVREVMFPAFSRVTDDRARVATMWLRVNRLVAAAAAPAAIGLGVLAPQFIEVVLGDRWLPAAPVIQILAWVGLVQSIQQVNGSVLQAMDRTGIMLRFAVVTFILNMIAFVVGLQFGIVGVAAAYALVNAFTQPVYMLMTARVLGLGTRDIIRNLAGVIQAGVLLALTLVGIRLALTTVGLGPGQVLAVAAAAGAGVYAVALAWRAPEAMSEFRSLGNGRRRRGQGA